MLSRRDVLKLGSLAGAAAALPAAHPAPALARRTPAGAEPFTIPLRTPPVLRPVARTRRRDIYRMTMRETTMEVVPGTRTRLRTFDGHFPGPTIIARKDRPVIIQQRNELAHNTAVHLHGGHTPHHSDGFPTDVIEPSGARGYYYPNTQTGATLWYHDHAHRIAAENVYRGLSGAYLLTDDAEERLALPKGEFDVVLQLRDANIAPDGTLVYVNGGFRARTTLLVNGRPQPYFQVAARKYRLRLVNTSNERIFVLRLNDGDEFVQVASDGGLLPAPVPTSSLVLWSGQRAEVVVDFSRYREGSKILLTDVSEFPGARPEVMRFDVVRTAEDPSSVPQRLRELDDLPEPTVQRDFTMGLDEATGKFVINGKPFDPNRVDVRTRLGTTEVWKITNTDTRLGIPHSLHCHLVQFRVLDRDGKPPAPHESGLMDVVPIHPGETVRVAATFTDYPGRYVYHCHMLDHAQRGMMAVLELLP